VKTGYETSQLRKDIKKLQKQGKELAKLKSVVMRIVDGKPLEAQYRDHALIGPLKGSRDCRIESNWLSSL